MILSLSVVGWLLDAWNFIEREVFYREPFIGELLRHFVAHSIVLLMVAMDIIIVIRIHAWLKRHLNK
jgi:hypothetical protein